MIHRILPILLLVAGSAFAKDKELVTNETGSAPSLSSSALIAPRYSGGGSVFHLFTNYEIGYSHGTNVDTMTRSGGGIMMKAEIGFKVGIGGRSESRVGLLSLSAAISEMDLQMGPKDLTFTIWSLPVSYTSMGYGMNNSRGRGFFWQVGANINYVGSVKDHNKKVKDHYASVFAEPFFSFGVSKPFRLMRNRSEIGGMRTLFGPFVSFIPGNLSKDKGTTLHAYTIGLKYTLILTSRD